MRNFIHIVENLSRLRDKAFDRFWWVDGYFEDVDSSHADWVVGHYSELATGDYDDPINELGDTEEDVNSYYIDAANAVRGGIMKLSNGSEVFLDGRSLRSVHLCLKQLLTQHPDVTSVTVEVKSRSAALHGEELENFIRRGKLPSTTI